MTVLYVTGNCKPFFYVTDIGIADERSEAALRENDTDFRAILPFYEKIHPFWREQMTLLARFPVTFGWSIRPCELYMVSVRGVKYYFLRNEYFFAPDPTHQLDAAEGERYAFFCQAVLEALPHLKLFPDIIHCDGWQTAMIPALLRIRYAQSPSYASIRTILSIRDISAQGEFPWERMDQLLLVGEKYYSPDYLEQRGMMNFLKGGIVFADVLVADSQSFCEQIRARQLTTPIETVLYAHRDKLVGIRNGIQEQFFDPGTDPDIPTLYWSNRLTGKSLCKRALQKECGLTIDADAALVAVVAPLNEENGLGLLEKILDDMYFGESQLIVLGHGDPHFEELFRRAQWHYRGNVAFLRENSLKTMKNVFAGSDMYLAAQRSEPVGLKTMLAMRYGCVPVAYATGAHRDIVLPFEQLSKGATGFLFSAYTANDMLYALERAGRIFVTEKPVWKNITARVMNETHSFADCVRAYTRLYHDLMP